MCQGRLIVILVLNGRYVMQTDYLLPGLTVKEALMYPALFRLPATMTREQKMEIVCDTFYLY